MITDHKNRTGNGSRSRSCYGGSGYFDPYHSGYYGGSGYYGNSYYGAGARNNTGNFMRTGYPYLSCSNSDKHRKISPKRGFSIKELGRLSYQSPYKNTASLFGVANHYNKNFSYLFPPSP